MTRSYATYRKGLIYLFCLVCFYSFSGNSQILEKQREYVRLQAVKDTVSPLLHYVGNYAVLDTDTPEVANGLTRIASEQSGTLFLVVRPNTDDSLSAECLLRVGPVRLFRDRVEVDGLEVSIPPIGRKPAMVKVKYQGRVGPWYRRPKVKISDEIELAEVIYYKDILRRKEVRVVESFLAMKYSINITENKEKEWRYYADIKDEKVWSPASDGMYDKEVLALGRLDRAGFYQSQTFSSDSRSIRLSLDTISVLGAMPERDIRDGSLLILSQRKNDNQQSNSGECGSSRFVHPWKLKFVNWDSPAEYLHLKIDTSLEKTQGAQITNGKDRFPIVMHVRNETTYIQIPIPPDSIRNHDFYLEWDQREEEQDCPALVEVEKQECIDGRNRLAIEVNPEVLPCRMTLTHRESQRSWSSMLKTSSGQLDNIGRGQYQLVIEQVDKGILKDEVFFFESCIEDTDSLGQDSTLMAGISGSNNPNAGEGWLFTDLNAPNGNDSNENEEANGDNGFPADGPFGSHTTGVTAYPNPGARDKKVRFQFFNLDEQNFRVLIFDGHGKLLEDGRFTPHTGKRQYKHTFRVDGSYIVKFLSEDYTFTQNIRIKSNL